MAPLAADVVGRSLFIEGEVVPVPDHLVPREVLGAGANAAVIRVVDQVLEREVALKVYAVSRSPKPRPSGWDMRDKLEQGRLEAMRIARVRHPNVATIHQALVHQDHFMVVYELLQGQTLKKWLKRDKKFLWPDGEEASQEEMQEISRGANNSILGQICEALLAAYDAGVRHGDLHLKNIIVTEPDNASVPWSRRSATAHVIDFGASLFKATGDHGKDLDNSDADRLWRELVPALSPDTASLRRLISTGPQGKQAPHTANAIMVLLDVDRTLKTLSQLWSTPKHRAEVDDDPHSSSVFERAQSIGYAVALHPVMTYEKLLDLADGYGQAALDGVMFGARIECCGSDPYPPSRAASRSSWESELREAFALRREAWRTGLPGVMSVNLG